MTASKNFERAERILDALNQQSGLEMALHVQIDPLLATDEMLDRSVSAIANAMTTCHQDINSVAREMIQEHRHLLISPVRARRFVRFLRCDDCPL